MASIKSSISKLYIALFGRAPDKQGLAHWSKMMAAGVSITKIANEMMDALPRSLEKKYEKKYGPSLSLNEIITELYKDMLGRSPDAEGLAFWTKELKSNKKADLAEVIAKMITAIDDYKPKADDSDKEGAKSKALFENRAAAAEHYADMGGDPENAELFLSTITDDPATVEKFKRDVTADNVNVPPAPPPPAPPPPAPEPAPPPAPAFAVTETAVGSKIWTPGSGNGAVTLTDTETSYVFTPATGSAVTLLKSALNQVVTSGMTLKGAAVALKLIPVFTGSVTVTDTTVAAADLVTIDTATTGDVVATAATTLSGTPTDLKTVAAATGITRATHWGANVTGTISIADANTLDGANGTSVITATLAADTAANLKTLTAVGAANAYSLTLTGGSAAAADMNAVDAITTVVVAATAVGTVTGSAADVASFGASAGVTRAANWSAQMAGTATVAQWNAIDAANGTGTMSVTGGIADSVANITGTLNILAAAKLTIGTLNFVTGTGTGKTDIEGGNNAAVDVAGEWSFNAGTKLLTYYNTGAGAAATVTLTGVANIVANGFLTLNGGEA